ncbi:Cadherin-23, partial [Saguinus oedipus]
MALGWVDEMRGTTASRSPDFSRAGRCSWRVLEGVEDVELPQEKGRGLPQGLGTEIQGSGSLPPHVLAQEIPPLRFNVYKVKPRTKSRASSKRCLNPALLYSFLKTAGSRDWEFLTIDPISGFIQTAQRLDGETQALILVASDLGKPVPYETTQPLQVALENIDDNPSS